MYEQEADRVADQVMAAPEHQAVSDAPPHIQRFSGRANVQVGAVPASVERVLASPGRPLEPALRQEMEERFGYDFSQVQVHSDGEAANAVHAVHAQAYTFGSNIVFGSGEYMPATIEGKSLLAHELVHVVQQSGRGASQVQRKVASHPRDRCGSGGDTEPCADWSSVPQRARLKKYMAKAALDVESLNVNVVGEILKAPIALGERVQLLRIACCQLNPNDAEFLHNVFSSRRGTAGKIFGNLSTPSRCAILSILDDRAATAGMAVGAEVSKAIADEVSRAERLAEQEAAVRAAAEAQWKRDKELHAKAGRTTWFDFVFPIMARVYRIPYAQQIHKPVLKSSAQLAERGASVSVAGAILDPITRPVEAVLKFIECMISSVKGKDVEAVVSRFGLKVAALIYSVFPAGVLVGATKEIGSIAKEIASIISDPLGFINELMNFFKLMWSPDSNEIACAMGQDMGEQLSAQLASIAKKSDYEFVYKLGELAGPLLLNTILAIVAPEVVAGLKGTRVAKRLLALLESLGDKIKFLDKWRAKGRSHPSRHLPSHKPDAPGPGKATTRVEFDTAAMKYIEENPPKVIINKDKPGQRRAPVGKDHEIVEKSLPSGIVCEFHSNGGRRVPCPRGMGQAMIKKATPQKPPQTRARPETAGSGGIEVDRPDVMEGWTEGTETISGPMHQKGKTVKDPSGKRVSTKDKRKSATISIGKGGLIARVKNPIKHPGKKKLAKLKSEFEGEKKKWMKKMAEDPRIKEFFGENSEKIKAMREGLVPKGYEVHHNYPLAAGGKNVESNFTLIMDEVHKRVTSEFNDAVKRGLKEFEFPFFDSFVGGVGERFSESTLAGTVVRIEK